MTVSRFSMVAALAIALLGFCRTSSATGIGGPYTVDADTLHLWHMDDAAGATTPISDAVSTNQLNLTNIDQSTQANNATGGITPTTANVVIAASTLAGFGNAANFANNALIPSTAAGGGANTPHRPVLLGATALSTTDGDAVSAWSFSNTTTNQFTWEAMIKFDSGFNPTVTNFRNGASGSTGGNYPMEIISGEGDANAHRNWQFRIDQIGAGTGDTVGATGTTLPRIEFANLNGIVSNQSIAIPIPTSGANGLTAAAVANGDWFHLAVEYNGSPNTANNLSFFWTDVSANPLLTAPVFLGSTKMNLNLNTTAADLPDFAVGDEGRDAGSGAGEGESFDGQIDEVRMSDNVRFAVPEPSSLALAGLGLVSFIGCLRRRK